jgi:hypothetical protein
MNDPVMHAVAQWHKYLRGDLSEGLESLLDDDVVFISPIVFTPQRGKPLTALYLAAAAAVFPGDPTVRGEHSSTTASSFHYIRELMSGHDAVLEFVTVIDGIEVNGVDMIRCNDEGLITEFKVMIRPLKAINLIHAQMGAMLMRLTETDTSID